MSALEIAAIPDRDERIAARRRRAEAKLRSERQEDKQEYVVETLGPGAEKVAESEAVLERRMNELTDDITDIRVAFDNEENERRIIEENARLDRYEALQIEAVSSGRKNAAVEMKWADLLYVDIPQELHDQLLLQKEACANILDSKDRRIREFLTELKTKDEEYQKMLKRQSADANNNIKKMRKQYVIMQDQYAQHLKQIQDSYANERGDFMLGNKTEIDEMFDKRRAMEETEFMETRNEREKGFAKKIETLRTQDNDEFNKSKIGLEKSIQELEQHLEKMVATYQLNKEKLDYNLQVLLERNKEHSAIQSSYKNRLNRLRETLNTLMTRYHNLDSKFRGTNRDLTEEYERLTRQFQDLQGKFKHFEEADEKKFSEVWGMHEQECRDFAQKILDCDKIIHEQQLGITWTPPKQDQLEPGYDAASETGTQTGKSRAMSSQIPSQGEGGVKGKFAPSKVKKVLDLVKEETFYLLDAKVKDEMHHTQDQAQRDVIQVNATLKYLGIESQEDVDLLVSCFFQGQDEDDENLYVEPDDTLKTLRDFMTEKENMRIQDSGNPDAQKKTKQVNENDAESKALRRKQEKRFWEKMGHVLPEMHLRVWKNLHKYLQKYHKLLDYRSTLVDNAVSLQQQNEELKRLLDQYLGSKVNEELHVPPTHVIRVVAPAAK